MKRRLFFSHTISLLIALFVLLGVNSLVLHVINQYQRGYSAPKEGGELPRVQALLHEWEGEAWENLDAQLAALGYRLCVAEGGRIVYASVELIQTQLYRQMSAIIEWPAEGSIIFQNEGVLMVGRQGGGYTVIAMQLSGLPEVMGRQRLWSETALLSSLASGIAVIIVVVLASTIFTRSQVRRLLRPVDVLIQAAKRVEGGNLSSPIDYDGTDEFTAVCIAFDHMQQHLLQEREKNAGYERARTDLVAGISHDLRTPLTSVKGYLKGLRDGVANTPEKQSQYLEIAYRKACDMERLLQQLFYFSKLESGNLPLSLSPTDLGEFVRRFVSETREELAPMGGEINLRGTPAAHPVQLDGEQMYRVLTNLKENALRYARAGPLVLTLTVWRQRDKECLRFADNGPGVLPEQLPRLFERFWRADQARSSSGGKGSGLGLYVVKHIVEAHGGTITARNDHGLVFDIELPCEEG